MKRTLVLLSMMILAGNAFSQIEKGTLLTGATSSLGFVSYTPSGSSGSSSSLSILNIGTKLGYFAANNFAFGLNLDYINSSAGSSSSSLTTVGLFLRYYTGKAFFGAGYNSISQTGSSSSRGSIPLELGFVGFVTKNIAIEPAFVYTLATDSDAGGVPGYAGIPISAKSAIGIRVGFTLYLNRPE